MGKQQKTSLEIFFKHWQLYTTNTITVFFLLFDFTHNWKKWNLKDCDFRCTYLSLTSLIFFIRLSFLSFAFFDKFSPFNTSDRKVSNSRNKKSKIRQSYSDIHSYNISMYQCITTHIPHGILAYFLGYPHFQWNRGGIFSVTTLFTLVFILFYLLQY